MPDFAAATSDLLVKSRRRVSDHGEVFTPPWLVDAMLDLVKGEVARPGARVLEPACGSGNFLVPVLRMKLARVKDKYTAPGFQRRQTSLWALMSLYGIELLRDNVQECRAVLLDCFTDELGLIVGDPLADAARYVLSLNIVHGDALNMTTEGAEGEKGLPITFSSWAILNYAWFRREVWRFQDLTPKEKEPPPATQLRFDLNLPAAEKAASNLPKRLSEESLSVRTMVERARELVR